MKENLEKLSHDKVMRRYLNMFDELEELHAAYGNAQKEIATLKAENERLEKSNYKMRGKNQKQGAQLLKCKNELRNPSSDKEEWKKYNKVNRSGKNV